MNEQSDKIAEREIALVWSAQEAARALRLSARTLWSYTMSGEIPHIRVGRRILYPIEELRRWMRRKMVGAATPD